MIINCDIGERGAECSTDIKLMNFIGMANIACGGHAGDEISVKAFLSLAIKRGVKVAAHLSYPDKKNFGRNSMKITAEKLFISLDSQYDLLSNIKTVKFHGALYNDSNVDKELSRLLISWAKNKGIQEIVTLHNSELAQAARKASLMVIAEAFAERNYACSSDFSQITLVNRSKPYASISSCEEAIKHATDIIKKGKILAYIEQPDNNYARIEVPIKAETICIHSDSEIALELAERLAKLIGLG